MPAVLWIGTRKGAFSLRPDARRQKWKVAGPQFLGHIIHHVVQDPRDPKTLLMAAKTGHLGPTVFRSADRGRTWREAAQPPAFRKVIEGKVAARAVERVFWLTPGHASERAPGMRAPRPPDLFRSEDGGDHWESVEGFNENPMRPQWAPGFATPDGEFLHSILVDPRDAQHLYLAISMGGVFESTDGGRNWTPLNEGCAADFLPDPDVPFGHDPHCLVMHPLAARPALSAESLRHLPAGPAGRRWARIGDAMPRRIGDIGFPIVLDPQRSRYRIRVSDGRPDGVAPHGDRWQTCGLCHA